ncbi:hypothetical protein [Larkinella punicea]|nr:hypothetical protein [Larkinella punicea]
MRYATIPIKQPVVYLTAHGEGGKLTLLPLRRPGDAALLSS